MYAITGITGQVGGAVARTLRAAGLSVRAVVRDAAKGAVWAARGCEIARAEMTDVHALTAAFAGARGVFVLIPPIFAPRPKPCRAPSSLRRRCGSLWRGTGRGSRKRTF
jgi:NAD(P)H dehydrogenase (quinone)